MAVHLEVSSCLNSGVRGAKLFIFSICVIAQTFCCSEEEILALQPQIEVTPADLSFDEAIIAQPNIQTLTVTNKGAGVLSFEGIVVSQGAEVFAVGQYPSDLGANQSIEVDVIFTPLAARTRYDGALILRSNDPENNEITIPLDGTGGFRRISVEPRTLDFGTVDEGAGIERDVVITNAGEDELTVESVTWTSTSVDLVPMNLTPAPVSLAAKTSTTIVISYHPVDRYSDVGRLNIVSNDEMEPQIEVLVSGEANLAPRAIAWGCQTVFGQIGCDGEDKARRFSLGVGQRVGLDGRESFDPEGDEITSYRWSIVESPSTSAGLVFHNGDDIQVRKKATGDFEVTEVGSYVLRLIATDERGIPSLDTPESRIRVAPRDLQVLLRWDVETDVDLHFVSPGGTLGDYGRGQIGTSTGTDCSWANRGPNWSDISSSFDDPRLDIDAVSSTGPEITSLNEPQAGRYGVFAHFCDSKSVGGTTMLRVEIYSEGQLIESVDSADSMLSLNPGEVWNVGEIIWQPESTPKAIFEVTVNPSPESRPELCLTQP